MALALGTRLPSMAAGAITVVAFALGWFAGVLGGIANAFDARALVSATEAVRVVMPTDALWRGVVYGLEPPLLDMLAGGRFGKRARRQPVLRDLATAAARSPVVDHLDRIVLERGSGRSGGGSCSEPA